VKVTIDKNGALLKPFSTDKIKSALFQMFPTKAPGPDGFLAHFFPTTLEYLWGGGVLGGAADLNGEDDPTMIYEHFPYSKGGQTRGTRTISADQLM